MGIGAPRDVGEAITRNDTSFETRIADVTVNRLDIPATYPFNTERHRLVVNGTEVRDPSTTTRFTDQPGKYQLTVGDGDVVSFSSRERLRYVPNYEALFGAVAWYNSQPTSDHALFVELSDDPGDNGYVYDFTPGSTKCIMDSGGTTVDTLPESEWGDFPSSRNGDHNPFDVDTIDRTTPLNPRGRYNWYGAGNFRPSISYTRPSGRQFNPDLGLLSNQEDIATEEINLRVRVIAVAAPGASDITVNVGSLGALIRGNATQVDRPAPFIVEGLGGSIGGTFAGNEPVLALKNAPDKRNVVCEVLPYPFSPGGTDVTELAAVVVPESDTDATGFVSPKLPNSQNNAIQATAQVTSFPTKTQTDIFGNTVTVPDIDRVLTTIVAQGGGNNRPASATSADVAVEKRIFDSSPVTDDEVVLFLPRQLSGSDGGIDWLKVTTRQDW